MYLIIESGYRVEVCRKLSPSECLDTLHHAAAYGRAIGYPIDTDNPGPTGIGADIDVTIQPTKRIGATHVWNSRGYWFSEGVTE